jgi:hypothetical protein
MSNNNGLENEVSFLETNFKTSYNYTDITSLAKRFQNLLVMEKDTLPNLPNCGIGIRNYLYNLKDEISLNEIKTELFDQIKLYLPNSFNTILNISVDFYKDRITNTTKGIIIYFIISTTGAVENAKKIAITAEVENVTNQNYVQNVLSNIYI